MKLSPVYALLLAAALLSIVHIATSASSRFVPLDESGVGRLSDVARAVLECRVDPPCTVTLAPGTWVGCVDYPITLNNHAVTIAGSAGGTVIDCEGVGAPVTAGYWGPNSGLTDLAITNTSAPAVLLNDTTDGGRFMMRNVNITHARSAAIEVEGGWRVEITDCVLHSNTAPSMPGGVGAAVRIRGTDPSATHVLIASSTISNNTAYVGGAIHASQATITLLNTQLTANAATCVTGFCGGGAVYALGSAVNLTGCVVDHNTAVRTAAGIYVDTGSSLTALQHHHNP